MPQKTFSLDLSIVIGVDDLTPHHANGHFVGFRRADSTLYRPVLSFEEDAGGKGEDFRDLNTAPELNAVGLEILDYRDQAVAEIDV